MMLHEPAVALTNFLLAAECGAFAVVLARRGADIAWTVIFAATAAAALFGGVVHGFLPDPEAVPTRVLWTLTILAIGVTAAALARAAVGVGWGGTAARRVTPVLIFGWSVFAVVVVFVSGEFVVAIAAYLPAALLLLYAFGRNLRRGSPAGAAAAISGVVLALVGAVQQRSGVGLHPVHFDHNAVYHLIQMVAMYLLLRAALQVGNTLQTEP